MGEESEHRLELPKEIPVYIGRQEFVVEYARGKDVLHLGCVDAGMLERKQQRELWLHDRVYKVANSLWGVDIDRAGIEQMRRQGYPNLFTANIENLADIPEIQKQTFDLVLLTEVLEHLNNPGDFLNSLRPILKPGTELLVTVPNATSLANLLENFRGRELVHPDHNYWYSMHTLQSLFNKYGYTAVCAGVYSQYDYDRSLSGHVWKRILYYTGIRSISNPGTADPSPVAARKPNPTGWLNAVITTLTYRFMLKRNPFFADGLIFLVKASSSAQAELNTG